LGIRLIIVNSLRPHLVGRQATMFVSSKWKVERQCERHQLNMKPALPTKGTPVMSSCLPGASPMKRRKGPCSMCIKAPSLIDVGVLCQYTDEPPLSTDPDLTLPQSLRTTLLLDLDNWHR